MELFDEQVRRRPSAVAVVAGSQALTYAELDARASAIAAVFSDLPPRAPVAVLLGASLEAVAAVLGVAKAGGVFVPLDPNEPDELLARRLADCEPVAVVTRERDAARAGAGRTVICLDRDPLPPAGSVADSAGGGLAAVLYPDGSDRGAPLEPGNLTAAVRGWAEVFAPTPADRHLCTLPTSSGAFLATWLRALGSGGTLVLAPEATGFRVEADDLCDLVISAGVTVLSCDPGTANRLADHLRGQAGSLGALRLVLVGGDRWYAEEQVELSARLGAGVRVVQVYGVAAAVAESTYFELSMASPPDGVSVIGRPFPGVTVDVAATTREREERAPASPSREREERAKRAPQSRANAGAVANRGLTGELVISGPTVGPAAARGRVRTGDRGRLRVDGLIEYLGFVGSSGDLVAHVGELEAALRRQPSVKEGLVALVGARIVAYVVPRPGARVRPMEVLRDLARKVPDARPVSAVVSLPSLPRTRAGRLDRVGVPGPAPYGRSFSVKGGSAPAGSGGPAPAWLWVIMTAIGAGAAWLFTDVLFPGATDLTSVPDPWASLFRVLYAFEFVSFGLGVAFLGGGLIVGLSHSRARSVVARLALTWLLVAWWPQDNLYRLAAKTDYPQQALLVFVFNVPLMIAAAALIWSLSPPRQRFLATSLTAPRGGTSG